MINLSLCNEATSERKIDVCEKLLILKHVVFYSCYDQTNKSLEYVCLLDLTSDVTHTFTSEKDHDEILIMLLYYSHI